MKKFGLILLALTLGLASLNAAVNINSANQTQLESLKGIGTKKAKAIIEYRTKTPFKSIEELKNVEGIGDKLFEKIKGDIAISGETTIEKKAKKERKDKDKAKSKDKAKDKDKDSKK